MWPTVCGHSPIKLLDAPVMPSVVPFSGDSILQCRHLVPFSPPPLSQPEPITVLAVMT